MKKVISPAAINALKEALYNIFWLKADLRSFITKIISDSNILVKLDWQNDYKKNIVKILIDFLVEHQDIYQGILLKLMHEIIKIDNFSYLKRFENGAEKAKGAEESVKTLRKLCENHLDFIEKDTVGMGSKLSIAEFIEQNYIKFNMPDTSGKVWNTVSLAFNHIYEEGERHYSVDKNTLIQMFAEYNKTNDKYIVKHFPMARGGWKMYQIYHMESR